MAIDTRQSSGGGESELREQGLAALLADVLAGEHPPVEWLVQYARDPGSLGAAERGEIEWHLAHTPGYRAELAVLRRSLAGRSS